MNMELINQGQRVDYYKSLHYTKLIKGQYFGKMSIIRVIDPKTRYFMEFNTKRQLSQKTFLHWVRNIIKDEERSTLTVEPPKNRSYPRLDLYFSQNRSSKKFTNTNLRHKSISVVIRSSQSSCSSLV